MIFLEWILYIFSWLFFISGVFIIFSCFIGFVRYKDFFIKTFAIKISNIYGISSVIFAQGLISENLLVFLQLLIIIILNILITITVIHAMSRIALNNNILHNGLSRRKYNEILLKEEKDKRDKILEERKNGK